jgi:hypothetical protein
MLMLGNLAGNQVILVVAGDSDKHVRPAGAYLCQSSSFAAVTTEADAPQFIGDSLADTGILLQHKHLVSFIKQGL